MARNYDAIIIGAGIIGACTALALARRGVRTLNVDRLPAAGYGSTSNSCAIVRTHYSTVEGTALAHEGLHYWRRWRDHVGANDPRGLARYVNTGCLVFKTAGNGGMRSFCAILDRVGIPWQDWSLDELSARFPFYDTRCFAPVRRPEDPEFGTASDRHLDGAVFFPDAGYIDDPQLATHNVQVAAQARGAAFRFNAAVTEIRRRKGRAAGVVLDGGEIVDAPVVVNVAGPHSSVINRMAGVAEGMKITTRALRQEVAYVPLPEGFDVARHGCVVSDDDVGCYGRPAGPAQFLIGSQDPECDPREWVDPDDFERSHTAQWTAQVHRMAQRMPGLPVTAPVRGVVDLYDVTDDWIPIYDKSDLPGFYMAVGTSGNQFKNAPVAGELMATLIERCEAGQDHDRDPVRFAARHTGRTLDLGFFSRLREIHAESSFTVVG